MSTPLPNEQSLFTSIEPITPKRKKALHFFLWCVCVFFCSWVGCNYQVPTRVVVPRQRTTTPTTTVLLVSDNKYNNVFVVLRNNVSTKLLKYDYDYYFFTAS
jgi:hypothetical protein